MELRQLAMFVAVAEEESFTRAARRLDVVQSAVSAGIRSLERELGMPLFERSTHHVRLSDAGHALLPEARATLSAADAAREAVDQVRGGLRGSVVFGTMTGQAMRGLNVPAMLARLHEEYPDLRVTLRHGGGSSEMADQVREGRLDLAILAYPHGNRSGLELTPLGREQIMVAAARTHPLSAREGIGLAELGDETIVELPIGWGTRMAVDHALIAADLTRTITYEVNDVAGVIEFIRHGLAVGLLPASFVQPADDIALIPITDHTPYFETMIATPSGRRISAATRAVVDTIKRQAGV